MAGLISSFFGLGGGADTTIKLDSDGTQYFLSIKLLNSKGEFKSFTSTSFTSLSIESDYTSPFLAGQLQVNNKENQNLFNSLPQKLPKQLKSYSSTFDGQEFLFIKIRKKRFDKKTCTYGDEVILEKPFVITNTINSKITGSTITNYYFTDIIVADLLFLRKEWTSNTLIGKNIKTLSKYSAQELQVKTGIALKQLLKDYAGKNIIDEEEWDDGLSTTQYTLPRNAPALQGITYLMSNYASSNNDLGIFTYLSGKFQLASLKDIFAQVYQKDNNKKIFKQRFTSAFKIKTEETDIIYTNKEAERLFPEGFQYIPIDSANIDFNDPDPITGVTGLVDHSLISYDAGNKSFNIFNKNGSIQEVKKDFSNYIKTFPDAKNVELNIPENDLFKANKVTNFITTNSLQQTNVNSFKSKISLQRKMFEYLSNCTFTTDGNFNLCSNKFLYLTITIKEKNDFVDKIPGFWYITKTNTTIADGNFKTEVTCSKFDRPL